MKTNYVLIDIKVDIKKVNLDVLRPWIQTRIAQLLEMEDEVVVEYVLNQLQAEKVLKHILVFNLHDFQLI